LPDVATAFTARLDVSGVAIRFSPTTRFLPAFRRLVRLFGSGKKCRRQTHAARQTSSRTVMYAQAKVEHMLRKGNQHVIQRRQRSPYEK
jgi:hypothetical protein